VSRCHLVVVLVLSLCRLGVVACQEGLSSLFSGWVVGHGVREGCVEGYVGISTFCKILASRIRFTGITKK
jgi:hypothetical protein